MSCVIPCKIFHVFILVLFLTVYKGKIILGETFKFVLLRVCRSLLHREDSLRRGVNLSVFVLRTSFILRPLDVSWRRTPDPNGSTSLPSGRPFLICNQEQEKTRITFWFLTLLVLFRGSVSLYERK